MYDFGSGKKFRRPSSGSFIVLLKCNYNDKLGEFELVLFVTGKCEKTKH